MTQTTEPVIARLSEIKVRRSIIAVPCSNVILLRKWGKMHLSPGVCLSRAWVGQLLDHFEGADDHPDAIEGGQDRNTGTGCPGDIARDLGASGGEVKRCSSKHVEHIIFHLLCVPKGTFDCLS